MTIEKNKSIKADSGKITTESQEMRDRLGQLLFERACELIRHKDTLSRALQTDCLKPTIKPADEAALDDQLAEFIIADDPEMVGRIIIDRVIDATWAMAEHELGLTISENPDKPSVKIENTH